MFINMTNFIEIYDIYDRYMHLRIYIQDEYLRNAYKNAAITHNAQDKEFMNAGFDLFVPDLIQVKNNTINKINMAIVCSAELIFPNNRKYNTGYYLYPRSSLSKTPMRLANSVGIIDAGYRGSIIGMFDSQMNYVVNPGDRLVQICAPGLVPIYVTIVDDIDELTMNTERGINGFGSSGK
jgi:dUTP pyrophosphatase